MATLLELHHNDSSGAVLQNKDDKKFDDFIKSMLCDRITNTVISVFIRRRTILP